MNEVVPNNIYFKKGIPQFEQKLILNIYRLIQDIRLLYVNERYRTCTYLIIHFVEEILKYLLFIGHGIHFKQATNHDKKNEMTNQQLSEVIDRVDETANRILEENLNNLTEVEINQKRQHLVNFIKNLRSTIKVSAVRNSCVYVDKNTYNHSYGEGFYKDYATAYINSGMEINFIDLISMGNNVIKADFDKDMNDLIRNFSINFHFKYSKK